MDSIGVLKYSVFKRLKSYVKWLVKHPKISLSIVTLIILLLIPWITIYQESWLDPFNTLSIPDYILRPHSFTKIGLENPNDPFQPRFIDNTPMVQELMRDLRSASPISTDSNVKSEDKNKLYFILHRDSSQFHKTADYSLIYFPDKSTIYFGSQYFHVDESTDVLLNQLNKDAHPGWWK